jgi:dipeptidyl-peptidase-4
VSEGSFPRRFAATRRFTLGRPRSFTVAGDGSRVAFLRSPAGDDPATQLWVFDVEAATERLIADPHGVLGGGEEILSAAERARRERLRESAGGVVAYAADPALTRAAFVLGGRPFVADLTDGAVAELDIARPVFDPRPDPTGAWVAYVSDRALRVCGIDGGGDRVVASEDSLDVSWGSAEFVAAEEMGRQRGYWWAPDGAAILAARVDVSPVQRWHLADLAEPAKEAVTLRYPAAGTDNADVSLSVIRVADGASTPVEWDRRTHPYLVAVHWSAAGALLLLVQSRDQRSMSVLAVDPATGGTRAVDEQTDEAWLEIVPGVPAWTAGGALVMTRDEQDTRRLTLDGRAVTDAGLQVSDVIDAGEGIVFAASDDPTERHVWRYLPDGVVERLSEGPGAHTAAASGALVVLTRTSLDSSGSLTTVVRGGDRIGQIASFAERPSVQPRPRLAAAGSRELRTALLLPAEGPSGGALPVLLDPYGGPGHARVAKASDAFLQSQWLADQGFAVLVADGRGTPGRGPAWERSVHLDLARPALEDQVDALQGVAVANPGLLDLDRVAIRGWSFGGYLAALAVLRRPDVFHAAVAGAPVTDWRLYDTHYTERYLGTPQERPEAYEQSSLLADASRLERPLMLIHGLADDNVVSAHTLRFSGALLAAGRPHTVLPLSGVTHMTPQEVVAENLLLLQLEFLHQALGIGSP